MITFVMLFAVLSGLVATFVICVAAFGTLVWLAALVCAVIDCHKKRRHGTLCSRCGQYQVYGKQGEGVCTNCGTFEKP